MAESDADDIADLAIPGATVGITIARGIPGWFANSIALNNRLDEIVKVLDKHEARIEGALRRQLKDTTIIKQLIENFDSRVEGAVSKALLQHLNAKHGE